MLRGMVNGQPTKILPVGEVYRHPNAIEDTTNALELVGSGLQRLSVFDDIDVGEPTIPEDLKTVVGVRELPTTPPEDPVMTTLRQMIAHPDTVHTMRDVYERRLAELEQQAMRRADNDYTQAGGDGEAVYTLALQSANLPDGMIELEDLTPDQVVALSQDLGPVFGIDWNSVSSVYAAIGGRLARSAVVMGIKLEQTFQAIGGARVASLSSVDQFRLRGIFLRELWATRTGRVAMVQGRKVITFRGYAGLRVFMKATYYPAKSIAVVNAGIISRNTSEAMRSASGSPFRGAGGVFLIFGGIIEVAQWMTQDGERFLSDLFIDLGVMIATVVISSVVATAAVMAGIAVAGIVAAPALVVGVAVGAVAIGVGWLITTALDRSGYVEDAKAVARRFLAVPQVFYDPDWHPIQTMGPLEGIDYLNNADPEEFDYIMHRGFGIG